MADLTIHDRSCREREEQLLSNLGPMCGPIIQPPLTEAEKRQVVLEYGVIKNEPRRLPKLDAGLVALWCFFAALVVFVQWFQAAFMPVGGGR